MKPNLANTDTSTFKGVMEGVGKVLNLDVDFRHNGWKVIFSNPNQPEEVYELLNYDIGLNSHQASVKAKDKSMAYDYLQSNNINAVEHYFFPCPTNTLFSERRQKETLEKIINTHGFPLVVKQNNGGAGKNIHFTNNHTELQSAINTLYQSHHDIAVSPFYEYTTEYRLTVLDNEVLMSYGKTKPPKERQHNLSKGGQVLDIPPNLKEGLHTLAINTAKALNIRFANIDIFETNANDNSNHNTLKVMEVNNGVILKRIVAQQPHRLNEAINVYVQAIKKLRQETN